MLKFISVHSSYIQAVNGFYPAVRLLLKLNYLLFCKSGMVFLNLLFGSYRIKNLSTNACLKPVYFNKF